MRIAAIVALAGCAAFVYAGEPPSVFYSKYFKGSIPEYVSIVVERSGQVVFKEAPDDERPQRFELSEAEAAEIFDLADKLNHFTRPLESPAKVANMGMKTFRWQDGAANTEVKFNFTEDLNARELNDWFERIVETEESYFDLERTVKFDKLGVNDALLRLEITWDRKRLVAPKQFLALLDRVSKNESYMHMARERASALAEKFRNPPVAGRSEVNK